MIAFVRHDTGVEAGNLAINQIRGLLAKYGIILPPSCIVVDWGLPRLVALPEQV